MDAPAPPADLVVATPKPSFRRLKVALAIVAVALGVDLARPPADQVSAAILLDGIVLYQATLSPVFAATGIRCRFRPTCSRYAAGAIEKDGALVGSLRAAWRILRCGPWTRVGTVDPP